MWAYVHPFKETYWINVDKSESIWKFRKQLYDKSSILPIFQHKIYYKQGSTDLNTLQEYGYYKGSTFVFLIKIKNMENHHAFVTQDDNEYKIYVNLSHSLLIEDIKFQVQDKTGFPYEWIQILINEVEFEDNESLMWLKFSSL